MEEQDNYSYFEELVKNQGLVFIIEKIWSYLDHKSLDSCKNVSTTFRNSRLLLSLLFRKLYKFKVQQMREEIENYGCYERYGADFEKYHFIHCCSKQNWKAIFEHLPKKCSIPELQQMVPFMKKFCNDTQTWRDPFCFALEEFIESLWNIIEIFIKRSALNINKASKGIRTLFQSALKCGIFEHLPNLASSEFLDSRGIDIRTIVCYSKNALQYSCTKGWFNTVKLLLDIYNEKGFKFDSKNGPLFEYACQSKNPDFVSYLLENCYNKNGTLEKKFKKVGKPLIHIACMVGNFEIVKVTFDFYNKKNIRAWSIMRDDIGRTPFYHASQRADDSRIATYFMENSKHCLIANAFGQTPIHAACESGNIEVLKYFIDNGKIIEFNKKCFSGIRPLQLANKKLANNLFTNKMG